jgi:DUF971 family protein
LTSQNDPNLELEADGHMLRFPAVWLRDNCPCAECLDPVSGQKLKDITELPDDVAVSAVSTAGDAGESVVVTFAPDRHRSVFLRSWLAAHALDGHDANRHDGDGRTGDDKELWLPADLDRLPEASWPGYRGEPADRASALDAVLRLGFVLLHDVPAEPGMVLEVAASFGFVRETNYGRLFDVRVEPRPERQLNLRLAPGDCLVFDNTRVMHARTAFSVTGGRHLQGCYADLDGLASTLAVLRREEKP